MMNNSLQRGQSENVYIIIVNWNGWKDTIECLESVFRNDYPSYQVVVCDNGSQDGSLDKIKAWAAGDLKNDVPRENPLYSLSNPPVAKPVFFEEYTRSEAESRVKRSTNARLILIRIPSNLGFSGGNNVGLRYALSQDDFSYAWLLNNDVVIKPDALTHLVQRMRDKKDAGMCGSTMPYYSQPETIWALGGGKYNKWTARSCNIGHLQPAQKTISREEVEASLDYLAGASMLVSRAFLHEIGLLSEDYFLFYEEPDWALRGKGKYALAYAPESIVYHKVGASTTLLDKDTDHRKAFVSHAMKSHIRFTLKFFPFFLPSVLARRGVQVLFLKLRELASRTMLAFTPRTRRR